MDPFEDYDNDAALSLLQKAYLYDSRLPSQTSLTIESQLLFGRDIFQEIEREANEPRNRRRRIRRKLKKQSEKHGG